eukprot:11201960-Lingulodinium_polyedra.AAC.1
MRVPGVRGTSARQLRLASARSSTKPHRWGPSRSAPSSSQAGGPDRCPGGGRALRGASFRGNREPRF